METDIGPRQTSTKKLHKDKDREHLELRDPDLLLIRGREVGPQCRRCVVDTGGLRVGHATLEDDSAHTFPATFGRRVSTRPWAPKRGRRSAPRPKTSIDESLQVSGQDWHAFASRNCIAAATHAANTGDHGDHAAEA